jgi:hypothetical protein
MHTWFRDGALHDRSAVVVVDPFLGASGSCGEEGDCSDGGSELHGVERKSWWLKIVIAGICDEGVATLEKVMFQEEEEG